MDNVSINNVQKKETIPSLCDSPDSVTSYSTCAMGTFSNEVHVLWHPSVLKCWVTIAQNRVHSFQNKLKLKQRCINMVRFREERNVNAKPILTHRVYSL